MDDYISRNTAIADFHNYWTDYLGNEAEVVLKDIPPADVKPVIRGEWELVERGKNIDLVCPNCKEVIINSIAYGYPVEEVRKQLDEAKLQSDGKGMYRYCPWCGCDCSGQGVSK